MQTYTMAELGKSPKKVCGEKLPVLITSNGKPQNIIINVVDIPIDESISLAQELYGQYCIRQMRKISQANGNANLTMDEIQAEIDAFRAEHD